jgi:phosphonoacetaldehyde hydrolase
MACPADHAIQQCSGVFVMPPRPPKDRLVAVLFDWAGTTVDHGSCAPAEVFREIFAARGVPISVAEAREPMGLSKRDHIAAVARLPRVATAWLERAGRGIGEADIDGMYADFLPLQKRVLAAHSGVIAGVPEAVERLRRAGLAIGSTTGYTRELLAVVEPLAAAGGYRPDVSCTADEVPAGRPEPFLNRLAAERLGIDLSRGVLVVDDTLPGIEAGRRSGCTTVGVSRTGNLLGLTEAEVAALAPGTLEARLRDIEELFRRHGADHVVESVADLPQLLGLG